MFKCVDPQFGRFPGGGTRGEVCHVQLYLVFVICLCLLAGDKASLCCLPILHHYECYDDFLVYVLCKTCWLFSF